MHQLCSAVSYIHQKGIVHRDLKLENILVSSIDIKSQNIGVVIADFGLSKIIQNQNTSTPCGTFAYAAPELLQEKLYSLQVDIWSLGCLLFTLLVAYPPFYEDEKGNLADKIRLGVFEFLSPFWDSISQNAKDLISNLLKVNPLERLRADQIESHPWFSDKISNPVFSKIRPLWSPIPSILKTPVNLNNDTANYFQKTGTPTLKIEPNNQFQIEESCTNSLESINLILSDSSIFKKRTGKK